MRVLSGLIATSIALVPSIIFAHGAEKHHENVKVLANVEHKDFDAGMKLLSKGLGVKCTACHVKGDYASDEKSAKLAARELLGVALETKDAARRGGALEELLRSLGKELVKNEASLWKAIDLWSPKKSAQRTTDHAALEIAAQDVPMRSRGCRLTMAG